MDDNAIIGLYLARAESAIAETAARYGAYCYAIACNILSDPRDSEESVNDTYLAAWNTIPPNRPAHFSAYLGKLTRHIALDKWKRRTRLKRGGGEMEICLEELGECVGGGQTPEQHLLRREAVASINRFLETLPETERNVFLRRYWHADSIAQIALRLGWSESKVASMLHRTRGKLKRHLQKEDLA